MAILTDSVSIPCAKVWDEVLMKSKFIASVAVFTLALAGALTIHVQAQTTQEGTGPSEQPSAPMEIGQDKSAQPAQAEPARPAPGAPAAAAQAAV